MHPQGRDVQLCSLEVTPQKHGGWSSAGLSSPPGAELKVPHRHTYVHTQMSKILAGWGQSGGCAFHLYPPHTPQKGSQSCQSSTKKKDNLPPGSVFSRMILFLWQPSIQGLSNYLPSDKGNVEKAAEG